MKDELCLIYSPFGSFEDAKRAGRTLVEEKLAACVNIIPSIFSIYLWKGKIEQGEEALLIAKTLREKTEDIIQRIKELHPYELPAILVIPLCECLEDFVKYVKEEMKL